MSPSPCTFDHILFPSYRQAPAYRRRVAAEEGPPALFGVGADVFAAALQEQSLPCRRLRGGNTGDDGTGALEADVLVCDLASAVALEPSCCAMFIAADLTRAAYPASEAVDAATQILARVGVAPVDDVLFRTRRSFWACEQLPGVRLVLERPLNNADASRPILPRCWRSSSTPAAPTPPPPATSTASTVSRLSAEGYVAARPGGPRRKRLAHGGGPEARWQ